MKPFRFLPLLLGMLFLGAACVPPRTPPRPPKPPKPPRPPHAVVLKFDQSAIFS